ncbi:Gfo/Idh/MocA family oxidoreductase [Streptomyces roseirectus]|uniref:Gfo/Idh/MocA family oxidoreductase n=1 Tax=Streptomyces roseirectus TaxID=2768066 RepID=A0A7H0IF56_9ACTN|nr:Gfo/Idh/MocA family oxidoreductase [Streptomyces roseirectus]QNP71422.1 Gfo/Idh/MocA family oxidoreductase [Streptomyces roseirectus]
MSPGVSPSGSRPGPRLALIGAGAWGRRYLRAAALLGADVAVCHTRHAGDDAAWLAVHHPGVRHTTSLQAALEGELDAVAVVTPRASHAGITLECLRRGLPVLVEKPAVTDPADLARTQAEARRRGLALHTGYTHCHDLTLHQLAALTRSLADPNWRLTWTRPAPGTTRADLVWEYYPHVLSVADLLGGLTGAPLTAHAVDTPGNTARVEAELPLRTGRGHALVSSTGPRRKEIRLYDGPVPVAVWRDRTLFDARRRTVSEAPEEPLLVQLRTFLDEVTAPGDNSLAWQRDRTVTNLLAALDTATGRAAPPHPQSHPQIHTRYEL